LQHTPFSTGQQVIGPPVGELQQVDPDGQLVCPSSHSTIIISGSPTWVEFSNIFNFMPKNSFKGLTWITSGDDHFWFSQGKPKFEVQDSLSTSQVVSFGQQWILSSQQTASGIGQQP